jgi:hypothetical protein
MTRPARNCAKRPATRLRPARAADHAPPRAPEARMSPDRAGGAFAVPPVAVRLGLIGAKSPPHNSADRVRSRAKRLIKIWIWPIRSHASALAMEASQSFAWQTSPQSPNGAAEPASHGRRRAVGGRPCVAPPCGAGRRARSAAALLRSRRLRRTGCPQRRPLSLHVSIGRAMRAKAAARNLLRGST